jgi:hypothetical protein
VALVVTQLIQLLHTAARVERKAQVEQDQDLLLVMLVRSVKAVKAVEIQELLITLAAAAADIMVALVVLLQLIMGRVMAALVVADHLTLEV